MELTQNDLLSKTGVSFLDSRLRRWREVSRTAFERASAIAAKRGIELSVFQAGSLYAHCLAKLMLRDGIETPSHIFQAEDKLKKLVEEVLF